MTNVPGEDRLDNISSVQAVHAISSNCASLFLGHNAVLICDLLPLVKTNVHLCHEMIESFYLRSDLINKLRHIFIFHPLALMMEVKPYIVKVFFLHCCNNAREATSDSELGAFLVDQVD